jgi:hypothetical protein
MRLSKEKLAPESTMELKSITTQKSDNSFMSKNLETLLASFTGQHCYNIMNLAEINAFRD